MQANQFDVAYNYGRFSSIAQKKKTIRKDQEQFNSRLRQVEKFDAYCKLNQWLIADKQFYDEAMSAAHGKNWKKGDLGLFLRMVESGQVKRNSVLVVENINRLSRCNPVDVIFEVVRKLMSAGIALAFIDTNKVYTQSNWQTLENFLVLYIQLHGSATESKDKSNWAKDVWAMRRSEGKLTSYLPAWLRSEKEPIPEKLAIVQRIFKLSIDGNGKSMIARILNDEKIPPIARSTQWNKSYIGEILRSISAKGWCQPMNTEWNESKGKFDRVPCGPMVKDHFFPAVSEAIWDKAQRCTKQRSTKRGRYNGNVSNLFQGLCHASGNCLCITRGGHERRHTYLGCPHYGPNRSKFHFPYHALEVAILACVWSIKLVPDEHINDLDALKNRLAVLNDDITSARQRWSNATGKAKEQWADVMESAAREYDTVIARIQKLEESTSVDNVASCIALIAKLKDPGVRLKLKQIIPSIIERIDLDGKNTGKGRKEIEAKIKLHSGKYHLVKVWTVKGQFEKCGQYFVGKHGQPTTKNGQYVFMGFNQEMIEYLMK